MDKIDFPSLYFPIPLLQWFELTVGKEKGRPGSGKLGRLVMFLPRVLPEKRVKESRMKNATTGRRGAFARNGQMYPGTSGILALCKGTGTSEPTMVVSCLEKPGPTAVSRLRTHPGCTHGRKLTQWGN